MKKALYIILLIVEFLLGAFVLSYMALFTTWHFLFLFFAVWAALTVLILVKLKKAETDECKRKLKRFLALVMLIPLVAGIATFVGFIVAWSLVI